MVTRNPNLPPKNLKRGDPEGRLGGRVSLRSFGEGLHSGFDKEGWKSGSCSKKRAKQGRPERGGWGARRNFRSPITLSGNRGKRRKIKSWFRPNKGKKREGGLPRISTHNKGGGEEIFL